MEGASANATRRQEAWAQATKEANSFVAQVDAVLESEEMQVLGSSLEEACFQVIGNRTLLKDKDGDAIVLCRTVDKFGSVEFLRGRDAAPPLVDERSTSGNVDLELDGTDLFNFNVLVTTTFACKDGQRLRLSTFALATYHSTALPSVRKALFGGGEIALMPSGPGLPVGIVVNSGMRVFTAVDDMEGETLSSEELHASRRLLRAANIARGLQVLVAMKSAIAKKWAKGLVLLSQVATGMLDERIGSLEWSPLMERVSVIIDGRPARTLAARRYRRAVHYEAAGLYREAAALYKQNIDQDLALPGENFLPSQAMEWCYYGIALKRAGDVPGAIAAYKAALRSYERGVVSAIPVGNEKK